MEHAIQTASALLRATDTGRCELIRGEFRSMNAAGGRHGQVAADLTCVLGGYVIAHQLGTIYAAETGFVLTQDPDTVRAPDFAFIGKERAVFLESGFVPGAPDLAVEILSPDDRPGYVREKISEWLESGALAVWTIDPRKRSLTVHTSGQPPRVFSENDVLDGGAMFPGLELELSTLFA